MQLSVVPATCIGYCCPALSKNINFVVKVTGLLDTNLTSHFNSLLLYPTE